MRNIPSTGTVPVEKVEIRQGGTAANIAMVAGILGIETTLISRISKNFPQQFIDELRKVGVNLELEFEDDEGPICYIVETDTDEIAFMYQGPMDRPGGIRKIESEYIHFATGNPQWIIEQMHNSKGFKVFDPGQEITYRWNRDMLIEASQLADLVILNEHEYKYSQGIDFKNMIITMGSRGCLYENEIIPAFKADVKSKVGAGDAFRAGLYFGLQKGMTLKDACRCGNLVSSIYISGNIDKLNILKSRKSCEDSYV